MVGISPEPLGHLMDLLDLTLAQGIYCLVGVAAGGFLRGFLGFGAALLIVPVLSLVLTPIEAIAILVLIEIPNVVYLTPPSLREFDFKTVLPMIFGLFVAVPIGTTALIMIDPIIMKFVISAVLLGAVWLLASGWRIKGGVSTTTLFTAGMVGGALQGSAGMGGPPLVTTLLSLDDTAKRTRANIIIALNTMSVMNAVTMAIYGKLSLDLLKFSLVAAVIYLFANMIGATFFRQNGNEHFRKVALGLLAVIAVVMIYSTIKQ